MLFKLVSEVFDFDLIIFDLKNNNYQRQICSIDFCNKVNSLVLKGVKDYASEVGRNYFLDRGYTVVGNYKFKNKKGVCDLLIEREGVSFFVEMKLINDKVSFYQLINLVGKASFIIFVVPKNIEY